MGSLTFKGIPEAIAGRLQAKWRIRDGEAFDASYVKEFLKQDAREELSRIRVGQINNSIIPDRGKLTVNVVYEFK
jgi:hypothetical protein